MTVCAKVGVLCATTALAVLTGCGFGGGEGGSGAREINWYVFSEPGGAYDDAVEYCNEQSDGRFSINYVRLPTDANQQRELLVRRLAAEDEDIDLIGMDVIWTAEFAQAGWIREWTGEDRQAASEGKLEGPLTSTQYQGKQWGIPFTSNTQLLWYRKDRVEEPPATWDAMIEDAERRGTGIEVQGRQYEGLSVWVNALIASAGGQIVDQGGAVKVDDTAEQAAEIINRVATSEGAVPGLSTNAEDEARQGFESGRSDYQVNYPFIYPSALDSEGGKKFQQSIGWARFPAVEEGQDSRPPLGGINIGVSTYSESSDLAFDAARCLASERNQAVAAELGGLPPTSEAAYETKKVEDAYPFADLLRASIEDAAPRPINPAYSDISLAIQKTYHPPEDIDPGGIVDRLTGRLEKAAEGKIF